MQLRAYCWLIARMTSRGAGPPSDDARPYGGYSSQQQENAPAGAILDAIGHAFASPERRRMSPAGRVSIRRPGPVRPLDAAPEMRRAALTGMLDAGPRPGERALVIRILLEDPDPGLRRLAAEVLAADAAGMGIAALSRALHDPDDEVRAAVVRSAARQGPRVARWILPLVAERGWPITRRAALDSGPIIARGVRDPELALFLSAVGRMDPAPAGAEEEALAAIARASGPERVVDALRSAGPSRLGAARVLLAEGSPSSLRAVSAMLNDPSDEMRRHAARAADLLSALASESRVAGMGSIRGESGASDVSDEEVLDSIAASLADPDDAVRLQAHTVLTAMPSDWIADWASRALSEGSAEQARSAALAASSLEMASRAEELLRRAASVPPEARGPFIHALASFRLSGDDILRLVRNVPGHTRPTAVRIGWELGGRAVKAPLTDLLHDTAGSVRMAVLESLAETGDPADLAFAQERLVADSSAAVRAAALNAVVRAGGATRLAALTRAMEDADPDVRASAVEALDPGKSEDDAELVMMALSDDDGRVWHAAVVHLVTLPDRLLLKAWAAAANGPPGKREEVVAAIERGGPHRLASIAEAAAKEPDPGARAQAVELAVRAGTRGGAEAVEKALDDPDPLVRRMAAAAMSTIRSPAAVASLARSLYDPHAEVRVEAVKALGLVDDDMVPNILIGALKDPEVRVRNMAADALANWRSPEVARRLVAALATPDIRRAAGEVLRRMGETAIEPLLEAAGTGAPGTGDPAGSLLAEMVGPDRFVDGLSSIDPAERLRSVLVLGAMGGPVAVEALLSALADPDVAVRSEVVRLLGASGDERAVRPLRRVFLTDPVAQVAAAAEEALRLLGSVPPAAGDVRVFDETREDQTEG